MKRINIISTDNGVGLTTDARILTEILSPHYTVNFIDIYKGKNRHMAEMNIWLEVLDKKYFRLAPINCLIPNQEWFYTAWLGWLHGINHIFAKTYHAVEVFKKYVSESRIIYTSFTSEDILLPDIEKKHIAIHASGRSTAKSSDEVFKAWCMNPEFMNLYFLKHENTQGYGYTAPNIMKCFQKLDWTDLQVMLNVSQFHICPSQAEGFGHYINEARSTGAVIISTDAAPMNEMVTERNGLLCAVNSTENINLGVYNKIAITDLIRKLKQLHALENRQVKQMSAESRNMFEENDIFFRRNILQTIQNII